MPPAFLKSIVLSSQAILELLEVDRDVAGTSWRCCRGIVDGEAGRQRCETQHQRSITSSACCSITPTTELPPTHHVLSRSSCSHAKRQSLNTLTSLSLVSLASQCWRPEALLGELCTPFVPSDCLLTCSYALLHPHGASRLSLEAC